MTSEDWSKTAHGSLPSTIKPHFFRKTFSGLQDMAAYEVQFYYKHGIVAYLNGIEIYRDNMPKGVVLPSTKASNVYSGYQYRGVIRNGQEAANTCILAVEVHTAQEESIEFDAWLGLYASSRESKIQLKVYPVPVLSATFEGGSSMAYAYDDNIGTSITFSTIVQGETYFEYYTLPAQVMMWTYYSNSNANAMTKFKVHGQLLDSEEWSSFSTTTPYNINEEVLSFIYTGTYLTSPSDHYHIYPLQANGLPVYVGEMQPYVYGDPLVQEVTVVDFKTAYELTVNVYVAIQPVYWNDGFTCVSEPELPEGLVFQACSIQGTPTEVQHGKSYNIYMHDRTGTRRRTTTISIVEKSISEEQGIPGYVWVIVICVVVVVVLIIALWIVRPKPPKPELPVVNPWILAAIPDAPMSNDVVNPAATHVMTSESELHPSPLPNTYSIPVSDGSGKPEVVSKASEVSPVVPENVPIVPESTPNVPESAPIVPESAIVPESVPNVPESAPNVPESAPIVPESAPIVPESAPNVPESTPIVPKSKSPDPEESEPKIPAIPLELKASEVPSEPKPLELSPRKPETKTNIPKPPSSTLPPFLVTLDSGLVINVNSLPPDKRAEVIRKYNL